MILSHETIELEGQTLFTWVKMKTPNETVVPIPSEACFAYIVDGDNQSLASQPEIKAESGRVILSLCGRTVGRMLAEQEAGEVSSIVVHFSRDILRKVYEDSKPPLWKELEAPVTTYIVQNAATELVKQYFDGLIHLFNNKAAVSDEILKLKLKEIILLLLQTENSKHVTSIMRSLFSERTFTFKEVIDAHICTPASVEDLAALTNNSLSSFKREFKKIYNATPGVYIIDKRIEKVAELLEVSDDSISNIGYECGFQSPAHLSRVFKSKYGLTPSNYRLNLSGK